MSKSAFEVRAATWLREKRDVELAPPDPRAPDSTRRPGALRMPSDAGQWGYRGLVLVAIASVLSLVSSRQGIGFMTERSIRWAAIGALVLGIGSLVVAAMRRVPSRPICVIFVPTGKTREATQVDAVKRAGAPDPTGELWLVSDAAWAPAALAIAGGARCFEPRGRDFVEVGRSRTRPTEGA